MMHIIEFVCVYRSGRLKNCKGDYLEPGKAKTEVTIFFRGDHIKGASSISKTQN
uniref:Uncharacterized protein n=1 Tax=Lepeophtheirus salmonis TaxID=72036 RepID=A0A0K2UL48_LEPSM